MVRRFHDSRPLTLALSHPILNNIQYNQEKSE
jgi:hypothetical protein